MSRTLIADRVVAYGRKPVLQDVSANPRAGRVSR
jgi:hypothetical protein